MKNIIEEYGTFILYFLIVVSFIGILYIALDKNKENLKEDSKNMVGTNEELKQIEKPVLYCSSATIDKDSIFDPMDHVKAKDSSGKDISEAIEIYGKVDTTMKGNYTIRYTVRDQYGIFNDKSVTFIVD